MTIRDTFVGANYNCAETVLLWANEQFGLHITPEDICLMSGFGGGLCCGENCGALLGAIAAFSRYLVMDKASATPGFREACSDLVKRFREDLGSIECVDLKAKYRQPDVRCLYVVERAAALLSDHIRALEETVHDK